MGAKVGRVSQRSGEKVRVGLISHSLRCVIRSVLRCVMSAHYVVLGGGPSERVTDPAHVWGALHQRAEGRFDGIRPEAQIDKRHNPSAKTPPCSSRHILGHRSLADRLECRTVLIRI